VFELTELTTPDDPEAVFVPLDAAPESALAGYHVRPKRIAETGERRDGRPSWVRFQFNLFPVVLDQTGAPWPEANIYILSRLENEVRVSMTTYSAIAEGLVHFRKFLDETDIDWMDVPALKWNKPVHRYRAHLLNCSRAGEFTPGTAARHMGAVVGFCRWFRQEQTWEPKFEPFKEKELQIELLDQHGRAFAKRVKTTDAAVRVPHQHDPYDGYLKDGGRLRPLPSSEQKWLTDALIALDNIEMTLVHLVALLTGARIQTALTLRVRNALALMPENTTSEVRVAVGFGTGVDTKNDKQMVLCFPAWFYQVLQDYANSERASKRRLKAKGGDIPGQHLFLSRNGEPFYESKDNAAQFDPDKTTRHAKVGQAVRQFVTERVIPCDAPDFHYRLHDLRATFGMNLTDSQLVRVTSGETTLHAVREFVKVRMGHTSAATTDLYLQYREHQAQVQQVGAAYEEHLRALSDRAARSLK
jgi:integrase